MNAISHSSIVRITRQVLVFIEKKNKNKNNFVLVSWECFEMKKKISLKNIKCQFLWQLWNMCQFQTITERCFSAICLETTRICCLVSLLTFSLSFFCFFLYISLEAWILFPGSEDGEARVIMLFQQGQQTFIFRWRTKKSAGRREFLFMFCLGDIFDTTCLNTICVTWVWICLVGVLFTDCSQMLYLLLSFRIMFNDLLGQVQI